MLYDSVDAMRNRIERMLSLDHCTVKTRQISGRALIRMFNKCSQNVLIELCRSFCTTFYCPYFWTQHKKATFSKLRVAYNNVYRKVFGLKRRSSASEMFVLNNISNFEALVRKSIFAFTTRLSNSKNAIICTIQRSWVIRDLIWKVWTDKLYI